MLYGAEAVAYLVQRLYQSLSEEIAMALCTFFCSPISSRGCRKPYQRVGKTNNISIMAILNKLTAKYAFSGGKVPKGATLQVVSQSFVPTAKEICNAIKLQLGVEVPEGDCHVGKFTVERIK